MNARDNIKPKTIRLAILMALADGAITTIDDLQIRMDEPRKKVVDNAVHAANDDLIKRLRDDVTGGPAYQITAAGRAYLVKYSGSVEEPIVPAVSDDSAQQKSEAVAIGVLETAVPVVSAEVVAQKDAEIVRLAGELAEAKASLELSRMARAVTPAGYATQRPGKPLARFTKAESAQARAMSAARAGKRAQVFALVPVGAAMPGAEWVVA